MKIALYIFLILLVILIVIYVCFHKKINLFIVLVTGKKRIQKKLYRVCKINDYLIINDFCLPMSKESYAHIDTIIFANKYIYIIKEIENYGEVKISLDDVSWRLISQGKLKVINNLLLENNNIIIKLTQLVKDLDKSRLKNIVIVSKYCKYEKISISNDEYILSENEVIKQINTLEKESKEKDFDSKEIEQLAKEFYDQGLKMENRLKKGND